MECEKCGVELNEKNLCCEGGTCCKACKPDCKEDDCNDECKDCGCGK